MRRRVGHLNRLCERVRADSSTFHLKPHSHYVGPCSVFADGYWNCCGVVIFGDNLVGVSHYDDETAGDGSFINEIIENLSGEIFGFAVGGDERLYYWHERLLTERKVPLVAGLCDFYRKEEQEKDTKTLIVTPSPRKVIVNGVLGPVMIYLVSGKPI